MMVHTKPTYVGDFRENRVVASATAEFCSIVKEVIRGIKHGECGELEYLIKCLDNPKMFGVWMLSVTGVSDEAAAVAAGLDACDEERFTIDDADRFYDAHRRDVAYRLGMPVDTKWDAIKRKLSFETQERLKSQGGVL